MISPHTAFMINTFSSAIKNDIINAIAKHETLRMIDLESIVKQSRALLYYHMRDLSKAGMIKISYRTVNDTVINEGYQLTPKAYRVIDDMNAFIKEMNKL